MHADDVALGGIAHGAHDGTANLGIARTPDHRGSRLAALGGMSVQSDVSHVLSGTQRAGKRCILRLAAQERKTRKEVISGPNHTAFRFPRPPLRLWANISFVVTGRRCFFSRSAIASSTRSCRPNLRSAASSSSALRAAVSMFTILRMPNLPYGDPLGRRSSHQPACLATMRAKSSACATGDFDFLVRLSAPASKAVITASWT